MFFLEECMVLVGFDIHVKGSQIHGPGLQIRSQGRLPHARNCKSEPVGLQIHGTGLVPSHGTCNHGTKDIKFKSSRDLGSWCGLYESMGPLAQIHQLNAFEVRGPGPTGGEARKLCGRKAKGC